MEFVYKAHSARRSKARVAQTIGKKPLAYSTGTLAIALAVTGMALLATGNSLGWLCMLPLAWFGSLYAWYKGDLAELMPGRFEEQGTILLHEALEPSALALLPSKQDLSAFELWQALSETEERYFMQNRFLIDNTFFEQFMSKEPGTGQLVWREAYGLQQKHQTNGYPTILVFVAMVKAVPNVDQLLRTVGLEFSDVETGISWLGDIYKKRSLARKKQYFGGIGRDWAYGYTPILGTLGLNISRGIEEHGFFSDTSMHEHIVQQMTQLLGSGRQTITLVGEEGVGKTTCVYAFAEALLVDPALKRTIKYSQVIQLDASTLIANAKRPGELEDLMIHIFNEAHHAKNIILFFDEAHRFFDTGTGSVDLSHVLQPILESGSLRIILAMNPQQWQKLAASGRAAKLTPVTIPPADEGNTLAILRDQVGVIEYRHKVAFTYQALQEAFKLGSRYVTTQAMPGAGLEVLKQAASSTQQQLITREVVQASIEQTYGIKVQTAGSQSGESNNLLHLEDELRQQVVSQDRAISVIANALRRSRSGVGNPDRPIGTFLFLGPTGVGKTELSKALARSYFGNEKALIRVDMNQYVGADDVNRLIAPMQGSDLGFLGEVRKQPFSVILLDEIEKAHSSVVNALLQMLDEGMMRDSNNQSVSFRDAIIIATSNAGADEIRRYIEEGKDISELETTFVDTLINRGSFAPEFVNRFDEVVLFKPLSPDDLIHVIDLIVTGINRTLDAQKVTVSLSAEAKKWLVDKGYDSKLGARPMRRMAQRYVENIVAKRLLEGTNQPGSTIQLDVADFEAVD